MHGKVMWFPEQFIMAHLPAAAKLMEKKLAQALASNRHLHLQNYSQSCQTETKLIHHQVYVVVYIIWFPHICTTSPADAYFKLGDQMKSMKMAKKSHKNANSLPMAHSKCPFLVTLLQLGIFSFLKPD